MGRMYMGPRGYEQWVPDCAINPDFSRQGSTSVQRFLNGGASVNRSKAGSKIYAMTWNMKGRDELRPIRDMAEGLFDVTDGVNLIYFLDPMAVDKNLLSQMYASPMQGADDGISWLPDRDPTLVPTGRSSLRYPARSAVYKLTKADVSSKVYIPVPPGYSIWVGVHGQQSGASIRVAAVDSIGNAGPGFPIRTLSVFDTKRVDVETRGTEDVIGIELDLSVDREIAVSFAWAGEADRSVSIRSNVGRPVATNWVKNPRLLRSSGTVSTPEGIKPAVEGLSGTNAVAWQDGLYAEGGGSSAKVLWNAPTEGFGISPFGTSPFGNPVGS